MGRKSKLSPDQWAEVERRILEGESIKGLGREFGISDSSIRERIAKAGRLPQVREVAEKILDAEQSLAALPISSQISARNLADKLRSISDNLASAADLGAQTAHHLNGLAHSVAVKITRANLSQSGDRLKEAAALIRVGNEAAQTATTLVMTQKDQFKKANQKPLEKHTIDPTRISSTALEELLAARDADA